MQLEGVETPCIPDKRTLMVTYPYSLWCMDMKGLMSMCIY